MGLGVPELLIILAIVLVIFGAKRLPEVGKSLGGGMREFKDAITRNKSDDEAEVPAPPALPAESENDSAAHPRS